MSSNSIPVFILGGFLGSGKTSTLNHILRNSQSSRLGVIVNDFGELPIDSYLIDKQVDNQIQLSNGCICCEVQDGDLVEALQTYTKETKSLSAIFIESSGLADPVTVANTVRYSGLKSLEYGGIIYTVDCLNFFDLLESHAEMKNHLRIADIILLNKTDMAKPDQVSRIKQLISSIDARGLVIETSFGAIDPGLLFDLNPTQESAQLSILDELADNSHDHAHHKFSSVNFSTSEPLNPKDVADAMRLRLDGVYRIKGIAYFGMKGMEQKYIFQSVRGSFEMKIDEWDEDESARSEIVAIGTNLDQAEVTKILKSTIDTHPDSALPGEMVDVRRLLERTP